MVFIIHGLGEHCQRAGYQELANRLVERSYVVFALDHQGHGKSNGTRVHMPSYEDYLHDIWYFISSIQEKASEALPTFIIGHSMGGALTLGTLVTKEISNLVGVVLSGSAVGLHDDPNVGTLLRESGKAIACILPKMEILPPLPIYELSRNVKACEDYQSDGLVWHGGMRVGLVSNLIYLSEEVDKNWSKISVPLHIIHGEKDTVVSKRASEVIFNSPASKGAKRLIIYPEMKHELFEDPAKEDVFSEIFDFFEHNLNFSE
eukprot:TRINITY_DN12726_c0_g1_i4.p1 TRINITY_DN12726_c0_g1~~TRINITY_DN12726_c0_g1_i4.p1  ORF type:complete len:261 (-),score=51.62 TRINITY_DN12726_c0_g1_i4:41-823(-)